MERSIFILSNFDVILKPIIVYLNFINLCRQDRAGISSLYHQNTADWYVYFFADIPQKSITSVFNNLLVL
jgi:hypothetical protein